ncbi:hypothetical protein [Rosenbergiella epipactidis]|uniref:hypothetical protein n=1 Tax=Rosenbergiella epipactidis TaxID=1544694 RepID=UPI003B97259C
MFTVIAELSAALAAIKEATGLAKTIREAKTESEILAATSDLNMKLLSLQNDCFMLGDMVRLREESIMELKEKISHIEDFKRQTDGYKFEQLESGAFVYARKQVMNDTETTVYLCTKCFSRHVVSILQPTGKYSYDDNSGIRYVQSQCLHCSATYMMNKSPYKPDSGVYVL